MNWLKQLFCKHIWKTEKTVILKEWKRLVSVGVRYFSNIYSSYHEYGEDVALYQECLKCGRKTIIEKEVHKEYKL